MAVAVRGSASVVATGSQTTLAVPVPGGTVDGDTLLMVVYLTATSGVITTPAGWTALSANDVAVSSTSSHASLFWRIAASEPASYTITHTSGRSSGAMIALSGAHASAPIDASAAAVDTVQNLTPVAPDVTAAAATMLVTAFGGRVLGNGVLASWTPDALSTEDVDVGSVVAASSNSALEVCHENVSSGATGTRTATATGAGVTSINWVAYSVAIVPAAGGGGGGSAADNYLLENGTDDILLEDGSGLLILEQQPANIITGSFNVNAALKRTQTGSFLSNAVIKRTQTGSFAVNAVLKRTQQPTGFLVDAWKTTGQATVSSSFLVNAVIRRNQTGTFTANAALGKTQTGSFAVNAIRETLPTGTFIAAATIKKTIALTFAANAVIRRTQSATFTAAAVIKRTQAPAGWTANAWLQKTVTPTGFGVDAVLDHVGRCIWTTPADGVAITATPTLTFLMPKADGPMHFEIQLDDNPSYTSPDIFKSHQSLAGWEYWNGSAWTPVPQGGVDPSYAGNEAHYIVQTPLLAGTYWRRVRAGVF